MHKNRSIIGDLRLTCLSTFSWAMIILGLGVGYVTYVAGINSISYATAWSFFWFMMFLVDQMFIKTLWKNISAGRYKAFNEKRAKDT